MASAPADVEVPPTPRPPEPAAPAEHRELARHVVRVVVALAVAVLLAALLWWRRSTVLEPPIEVVGYPTLIDFDFRPMFLGYRLLVWFIPAVTLAGLAVLWRWGPLRARRTGSRPAAAVELDQVGPGPQSSWWSLGLVLPAAVLLAVAVSSVADAPSGGGLTAGGLLAGAAQVASVAALAAVVRAVRGGSYVAAVATANGPMAAGTAALAFAVHVRATTIYFADGGSQALPWLPLWALCVLTVLATVAPVVVLLRGASAERVQRWVTVGVVGVAAVLVTVATVPGPVIGINGFDDMQSVAGADLMSRGYLPWRDVTFIHGVFEDGLRSWAGFELLGHTLWATSAVLLLLWIPLAWSMMFVLGAWAVRARPVPTLLVFLLVVYVSTQMQVAVAVRWCFAPIVFVLLGEALRRRSARWLAAMTVLLFVEAVLVPEASFQVIAVTVVVVLSDLVGRDRTVSLWAAARLTRTYVVVGAVCVVLWAGFLALLGSLRAFVDYFVIFGPGHVESGALPLGDTTEARYERWFAVMMVVVAATLLLAGWRAVARRPVTAEQWVLLAAAILTGLYGEKALGRFDSGHVTQAAFVAVMLGLLWTARLVTWADLALTRRWTGRHQVPRVVPIAAGLALVVVLVGLAPLRAELEGAPSANRQVFASDHQDDALGYAEVGAYDPSLLADLREVVDTLGGPDRTVFDFTNAPGWFWYMLGLDPTTSYFHVSMAAAPFAQDDLIDQLESDPPALVAFRSPPTFGLPGWDYVPNEVRHYDVSQYVLDNWTPVLSTHGILFLLRDDLAAADPALPALSEPPVTTDLYATGPPCTWGDIPTFLGGPDGPGVGVDVAPSAPAGRIAVAGWAVDPETGLAPERLLVTAGSRVVATATSGTPRPDVAEALGDGTTENAGFTADAVTAASGNLRVYAQYADGRAYALTPRGVDARRLRLEDGSVIRIASGQPGLGSVDSTGVARGRLATVDLPPDLDLASVGSATFELADGDRRRDSDVVLTGSQAGLSQLDGSIQFGVLARGGDRVSVRVGACLPWHGFDEDSLYVFRRGGADITRVTFVEQ